MDRSILLPMTDSGKQRDSSLQRKVTRRPVIAIIGSGSDIEPAVSHARTLGRRIAESGWILLTGGRHAGVMKAANEGAKKVKDSLTIGILPGSQSDASPLLDVAIVTNTGQARNNIIVLSSDVVIACGVDGAGTSSEVSLALKNGKPVILLGASLSAQTFFRSIGGDHLQCAGSPEDAVEGIKKLLGR